MTSVTALELVSLTHYCHCGDVQVDATAVIAAGVVLLAEPGTCLRIEAGVMIGAGAVIQARQGSLTLAAGAIIGAGALVVGQGYIGQRVCIGSLATVVDPAIAPNRSIPANSLALAPAPEMTQGVSADVPGQNGAAYNGRGPATATPSAPGPNLAQPGNSPSEPSKPENGPGNAPAFNQETANAPVEPGADGTNGSAASSDTDPNGASPADTVVAKPAKVYGQAQVASLLTTLFPHRQPLSSPSSEADSGK